MITKDLINYEGYYLNQWLCRQITAKANQAHVRCADWPQDSRQHATKKRSSRPHCLQEQAAATASQLSDRKAHNGNITRLGRHT